MSRTGAIVCRMAKKVLELDTPFRTGERVVATRPLRGAPIGTIGKVRLVNGLSDYNGGKTWLRYWVRFEDGKLLGQIDHNDLVRPIHVHAWQERENQRLEEANRPPVEEAPASESSDGGSGEGGIASLIPAALLERSRAAKARLLGG